MIAVAVMHTPGAIERRPFVEAICREIPSAIVVEDRGRGLWDTATRAWSIETGTATHHLVLQDDARLCVGFSGHVGSAIAARPLDALSFFSKPDADAGRWFTCRGLTAVATCLPIELAREWSAWMRDHSAPSNDDTLLIPWLAARGLERWFSNPSLVQHGDVPSLLGHPEGIRCDSFRSNHGAIDWMA